MEGIGLVSKEAIYPRIPIEHRQCLWQDANVHLHNHRVKRLPEVIIQSAGYR